MTLQERAQIIPGASMTRSKRIFNRWASHAEGAIITDTEGRQYIDTLCGLGAISLGYGMAKPCESGVYSLPHRVEVEAAEAVLKDVAPWASWVRFLKTGSEATHAAYRIAKHQTGRHWVSCGWNSYHGWHEWSHIDDWRWQFQPFGYEIGENPDRGCWRTDVAAVFVEPARFGPTTSDWLHMLRRWCDKRGVLLVFDSMIWGGRFALGGASEYYGVIPDLECYGKAFGNGQSVAFIVGTDKTKPHGEIPSGTFSGETNGLSALREVLWRYKSQPVIETIWERGRQLQAGLNAVVPEWLGVVEGEPPCQRIKFHNEQHAQPFTDAMLERGVIMHPNAILTMYAHSESQIDQVIAAAKDAVETL